MGPRLREAIAIVGVMVLAALGAGRAVASLPEPSNVPPFIRTPEPGIFDTLPGPPTSPRAFADREIIVPSLPPPPAPVLEADGTLVDVSAAQLQVSRGPPAPDMLIGLGPQTTVYVDGEPAAARDLEPGMPVHVEYDLDGHERIARRVQATTSGSPQQRR